MVFRVLRLLPGLAVLIVLVAVMLPANALARASATGLRLGAHPDGITRLVLDLSDSIDFSTALYADPYRVVVNTPAVTWATDNGVKKPYGSVRGLRYDEDSLGGRIMIELKEPATVKSAFVIPPRDGLGWRFVMDLQTSTRAAFLAAAVPVRSATKAEPQPAPVKPVAPVVVEAAPAAPVPVPAPAPIIEAPRSLVVYSPETVVPKPVPVPEARPKVSRTAAPIMSAPVPPPLERPIQVAAPAPVPVIAAPAPVAEPVVTKVSMPAPMPEPVEPKALPADGKPVVVIDPGHGGVDPGAIGVSGIYEKYITLAVARELKAQLEKSGHYKVFLTRDRDVFIRLRDRVAIARQYNADLFISLHADSVGNPQLKGLSVYTLSQNSSDSEAQALADKENKADLIAGIDLSHESADVANILIDLAQRETMNRSAGFAGGVVEEVGREANLLGNTHRFAGFAVLKAPDVPSVLVEMGYLSNETEERSLRQPEHRVKLAKSISRAIDRFFVQGQKARRP
ncbi:MAG: N-acetylmuramoyl-L-alanine amidase [Rhodospirillaceae bacterium]|nr:N-acetylmuramoyl-L-alanine amidase [Rhodospirillales bacterium]